MIKRNIVKKNAHLFFLSIMTLIVLLILSSCAGGASSAHRQSIYRDIDEALSRNDFEGALQLVILAQAEARPLYDNNNVISLYLNKGLLEHFAGLYSDSANSLLNAERLIQEAFTRSISQSVATYIINDNSREYPGEDFEDIYLSVFNALNFFNQGNIEAALVEIRKLTLPSGKLELLSRKYDDGNARIRGEHGEALSQAESAEGGSTPVSVTTTFTNSALARYLSILFYQADRNYDAVRIELEQLRAAFVSQPNIYSHSIPYNVINNIESGSQGVARLDILSFVGLSPIKEEEVLSQYFPFFTDSNRFSNIYLPKLVDRPNRIDRIEIIVGDEKSDFEIKFNLELLEDMGAVIRDTFNARYTNIFLKTYIRTLLKHTANEIAIRQAAERGGNIGRLAMGVFGSIVIIESENADIRMSRFLPNKAYIGNVNLEPGTYTITANFYSGAERIRTKTQEEVVVRANTLNLTQFTNLDFTYIHGGN